MPQNPNVIVSVNDEQIPPPPAAPQKIMRSIGFADGRVIQISYGPNGAQKPLIGEDGSWMFAPGGLNGAQYEGGYTDNTTADNYRQQGAQDSKSPPPKGDIWTDPKTGIPYQIITGADGTQRFAPLQGAPAAPPPNWQHVQLPDGTLIAVNPQNPSQTMVVANPTPTQIAQAQANLASTGVNTAAAVNTDARANQKMRDDQVREDLKNRILINDISKAEADKLWGDYKQLSYDLPRQYQSDVNAARVSRNTEATSTLNNNLNRESYARQAGQDQVNDAQWTVQNGVSDAYLNNLQNMSAHPGQVGADFRTAALPMPNFGQIRSQGQEQLRAQVPSYADTLAGTPAYGVVQPDIPGMRNYWQGNVLPNYTFGPTNVQWPSTGPGLPMPMGPPGLTPPMAPPQAPPTSPYYVGSLRPPEAGPDPAGMLNQMYPWYGDPRQMPPDWGNWGVNRPQRTPDVIYGDPQGLAPAAHWLK